jgi:hypothetical protein
MSVVDEIVEVTDPEVEAPADPAGGDPPEGADTGDKGGATDKVDPEVKRLQRELKAERRLRAESQQSERYWAEQARNGAPKAEAGDPEPEPEPDIDVVSELSTNGVKGLETVLKKLGYVKAKDVDTRIATTRAEITDQARLFQSYPDLQNEASPLFKATARIYNQLKGDPTLARSPKLIEIAARTAKAELGAMSARRRTPETDLSAELSGDEFDEDLGDDELDEEQERTARVARQAGDRGRRGQRSEPETLSPEQKRMVAAFASVGAPVTEDGYRKRAQAGIRMGGAARRHR